jgi:hypothetical protein
MIFNNRKLMHFALKFFSSTMRKFKESKNNLSRNRRVVPPASFSPNGSCPEFMSTFKSLCIKMSKRSKQCYFPRVLIFCTINGRFKLNDLGVYSRVHSMQIIPEEFLIFGSQSYKLSSIIYHTGESMLSGHYVTAVNIGKIGCPEWYVVNDDKVGEKKTFYPPDGVPIMPGWDLKQLDMTVEEYVRTGGWVGSCPTQNFWMCMLAYTEVV